MTAAEFVVFDFQAADKEKQEQEKEAAVDEQGGLIQSRRASIFSPFLLLFVMNFVTCGRRQQSPYSNVCYNQP